MSLYGNTPIDRVSLNAGSEQVTIASNYGVCSTVECKEVFVQACLSNATFMTMSFSSAVSSSKGIVLPSGTISNYDFNHLRIPVCNLNMLHFWSGTDGDQAILEYRR